MTDRLIVGCGYLGSRVGRRWLAQGGRVHVMTRSAERAARLKDEGYAPIVADVTDRGSLTKLPSVATVLYAVGFDRAAGRSMRQVYVDGLSAVLDALSGGVGRFIYISSTSVYGQIDGSWIDEESPTIPARENGRICLEAEQTLTAHRLGSSAIILRLAGIYGPGRIPRREALLAGEPIAADPVGYLNLIHVEDAATVIQAAESRAPPPRLYRVSDGHPVLRREYYQEAARLVGAPPPRFTTPAADSARAERGGSDKRVNNARMLAELGVKLAYPTYRDGLQDCLRPNG